jgi:DmsE family decaheme c-type cytochrome
MTGRRARLTLILASLASVSLLVALLLTSRPTSAQAPTAPPTPVKAAPAGASPPPGYVGAETCMGCHEEAYRKFEATKMGLIFLKHPRNTKESLGCENCHGPGQKHVEAGGGRGVGGMITFAKNDPTPVAKRNEMCQSCHSKGDRVFWRGSAHESRDVACTTCHRVMENISPRHQLAKPTQIETCGTCHLQKRAQQMRSSHMPLREGKMTCTSCHNPHGTVSQSLLKETSINDTCFTCHAEKRGPFLWQHAPQNESCMNCHDPHGSNHERMLKVAKPRLCQQCHNETQHPTNPYGRDAASLKFVLGRQCLNCHVNIHGSNHPSGFAFTR